MKKLTANTHGGSGSQIPSIRLRNWNRAQQLIEKVLLYPEIPYRMRNRTSLHGWKLQDIQNKQILKVDYLL